MKQDNRCLEVNSISSNPLFGDDINLVYYPKKAIIDFHPFFNQYFSIRDKFFNDFSRPRFTKSRDSINYHFTSFEFQEAFGACFGQKLMIPFLKEFLFSNLKSKLFLETIGSIEKNYQFALMQEFYVSQGFKGKYVISIYPVNFKKEEIDKMIRLNFPKKSIYQGKNIVRSSKWYSGFRDDIEENNLSKFSIPIDEFVMMKGFRRGNYKISPRICFLEKEPVTIIAPPTCSFWRENLSNPLDYFELIKEYDLPTEHLKLVRKR